MPESCISRAHPRAACLTFLLALASLLALAPGSALALRYASPSGGSSSDCKTPETACSVATAIQGVGGNMPTINEEIVLEPGEYTVGARIEDTTSGLYIHGAPGKARPVLAGSVSQMLRLASPATLAYVDIEEQGTGEALFADFATVDGVLVRGKPKGVLLCQCYNGTISDSVFVNLPGSGDGAVGVSSNGGTTHEELRNDTIYSEAAAAPAIELEQQAATGSLTLQAINTIAVNTAGGHDVSASKLATITMSHSDYANPHVEGGGEVTDEGGPVTTPPLFANPAALDFHELAFSLTVDAGVTAEANGLLDFEGGPRLVGAATDIGALEYQPPATVVTGTATSVSQSAAVLNGSVNPNGAPVADCRFEYGATEAYGSSVACRSLPGSGASPVAVSAQPEGLTPASTYHYRLVATNGDSTSYGGDQTVTTAPVPPLIGSPGGTSTPPPPASVRLAFTLAATKVSINPSTRAGTLRAGCRGRAGTRCTVTGTLYAAAAVLARSGRANTKLHLKVIGTLTGTIAAGATGKLRVKLTRSALRTLRHRRSLPATLAVKVVDQGERINLRTGLRLKLAAPHR